jgi:hypothetical protein
MAAMTTIILDAVFTESGWRVRSPLNPGWHPKPSPELDRAAFEANFKSWQTRRTTFDWFVTPSAGDLAGLGYEAPA